MALELTIPTQYGINATYHKIALVNIDWHNRESHIEMLSFVDLDSRENGAMPLSSSSFDWSDDDFLFQYDLNNVQQAYTKIKTLPEWIDSVDV